MIPVYIVDCSRSSPLLTVLCICHHVTYVLRTYLPPLHLTRLHILCVTFPFNCNRPHLQQLHTYTQLHTTPKRCPTKPSTRPRSSPPSPLRTRLWSSTSTPPGAGRVKSSPRCSKRSHVSTLPPTKSSSPKSTSTPRRRSRRFMP
jgi:hypothetical protein